METYIHLYINLILNLLFIIKDYYIKLLKINEVSVGKDAITGMLLVYPEYCIHLIEVQFHINFIFIFQFAICYRITMQ